MSSLAAQAPRPRRIRPEHVAAGLLSVATIAAFWPARDNRFLASFDDIWYVSRNATVARGLTAEGLRWAFTSVGYAANWHPLTWLSHMLDVQLFALEPGGHHLTSVLIHSLSAALLLLVLFRMTGALGRSAAVAALFALHPLRAESVGWIAERKDVLSGLFFMVTLLAYLRWARQPRPGRFLGVAAAFALGLLSKPMLVTLPLVLLLLDFWPLGRLRPPSAARAGASRTGGVRPSRLLLEKVPLLALSVASSAMTLAAQADALGGVKKHSFPVRLANAAHSYGVYLVKTVWPTDLVIFYPHPGEGLDPRRALAAGVLLAAITLAAVLAARSRPYLLTGWLWYLGILVPVVGLVQQSGAAAMADRYTYLPVIGVLLAAVWWIHGLLPAGRRRGQALAGAVTAACLLLGSLATLQVRTMRDDETVYRHMLSVDATNVYARNYLGGALIGQGRLEDAAPVLSTIYRPEPRQLAAALVQQGARLAMSGAREKALLSYAKALALDPGNAPAAQASAILRSAGVRLPPGAPSTWMPERLIDQEEARIWLKQGDHLAAAEHYAYALNYYLQAVRLDPGYADAWNNLGSCYGKLDRHREAAEAFEKALAADPGNERARRNLEQARRSLRLSERTPRESPG